MSYPQFGYPYPSASALASPQMLAGSAATAGGAIPSVGPASCDPTARFPERPLLGESSMAPCTYSASSLLSPPYSSLAGLSDSVYSSAYAQMAQLRPDATAFYNPLQSTCYDLKDGDAWQRLHQPTACYPYDASPMAYPYAAGYHPNMPLNGAQRKNATREATSTLKAWLHDHIKNPYPTKGEKIMLAIITKMTLTQVSTWFANARRRLKKENKMTWSPRNRCEDDDDLDDDDDREDRETGTADSKTDSKKEPALSTSDVKHDSSSEGLSTVPNCSAFSSDSPTTPPSAGNGSSNSVVSSPLPLPSPASSLTSSDKDGEKNADSGAKPRIWSVADVITSSNASLPAGLTSTSSWLNGSGTGSGVSSLGLSSSSSSYMLQSGGLNNLHTPTDFDKRNSLSGGLLGGDRHLAFR